MNSTVLFVSSYFKSLAFFEAARQAGCRAVLLSVEALRDESWPVLDAIQLLPDLEDSERLLAAPVDYVLAVEAMGPVLERLVGESLSDPPEVPAQIALEVRMTERALEPTGQDDNMVHTNELGGLTAYTCPDCGGPLWQISGETRFRCHVGHAYSIHSLLCEQDSELEHALWAAVRSLEARHKMLETLAESEEARGVNRKLGYRDHARESKDYACTLRELLLRFSRQ